jgi:aspartyl-tRNA(Asn)/glutamyl-tRNA(Gln) amidotransferase subunit A
MPLRDWPILDSTPTLTSLAADLTLGRLTVATLLERCLAAIDRLDSTLRAWILVDRDQARQLAAESDARRDAGRPRSPLDGIPFGVKDLYDIAGLPTTAGARYLAAGPAADDADVVASLRSLGMIPLGKTVTTPYAWIDPPPTTNPWNHDRTPGGSSSGSAAAVAAGMVPAALGSQTGGSITRPAAYCGVCGLKPTYGRLSARGVVPLAPSLDHPGLITRTIADLQILWAALHPTDHPAPPPAPPRIGRLRGLFDARSLPVALDALDQTLDRLRAAGATIAESPLPSDFEEIPPRHRRVMAAEAARVHDARQRRDPDDYPARITELIEEGRRVADRSLAAALDRLAVDRSAAPSLFDGVDVLITPAAPGPAPDRSTTGDPALNSPWSYLGLPTVCLPIALDDDGLPLAAQLIGPPNSEAALLALARWCEQIRDKPPTC